MVHCQSLLMAEQPLLRCRSFELSWLGAMLDSFQLCQGGDGILVSHAQLALFVFTDHVHLAVVRHNARLGGATGKAGDGIGIDAGVVETRGQ